VTNLPAGKSSTSNWFSLVTTSPGLQQASASALGSRRAYDRFQPAPEDLAAAADAAGVDGGTFPGVPGQMSWRGFEACTYCDFDTVCPSTREREWSRKRSDPALRPVVVLRDGRVPDDVDAAVTTDLLADEVEVVG
jgi:hypothetical protein